MFEYRLFFPTVPTDELVDRRAVRGAPGEHAVRASATAPRAMSFRPRHGLNTDGRRPQNPILTRTVLI